MLHGDLQEWTSNGWVTGFFLSQWSRIRGRSYLSELIECTLSLVQWYRSNYTCKLLFDSYLYMYVDRFQWQAVIKPFFLNEHLYTKLSSFGHYHILKVSTWKFGRFYPRNMANINFFDILFSEFCIGYAIDITKFHSVKAFVSRMSKTLFKFSFPEINVHEHTFKYIWPHLHI